MMVTFEHCSEAYNGEPLQLLPYSVIDIIPVIIFHCSLQLVLWSIWYADFFFSLKQLPAKRSAPFIVYLLLKLEEIFGS